MTTTLFADCTVESRCAITRVVLAPRFVEEEEEINRSSASCTSASDVASSALVASSSSKIVGLRSSALAIAIRCFWPPDNLNPLSPTSVSYCSGNSMIKS
mmetsp:Transcript_21190/g.31528  ORF Transcript_21190/g.31528 Transcript_21190/m.31528 type:complete len:100 (-) Transcript_21190:1231-1530(-)